MPTTHTDQFYVMDPGNPPPNGTALAVQNFSFVDNNDDGFIGTGAGDTFNGDTVTSVWVNDQIRVRWADGSTEWITGVTFYVSGQPPVFTPTDGTVLEDATFLRSTFVTNSTQVAVGTLGPICFTPGTLIETDRGLRKIENLTAGDRVLTRDHGFQVLRWIGSETAAATGVYAPVAFAPGAIGNRDPLVVSQQHRVLVTDWRAQLFAGEDEVLVAAKHLVNGHDITLRHGGDVTYVHILFDRHEVVKAGGVWSESLYPGHVEARESCDALAEARAVFGDRMPVGATAPAARAVAKRHIAACMAA